MPLPCSEDDRLDAVTEPELHEDPSDVGLDGPFADEQSLRDLAVGQPLGHEREHLALAGSQTVQVLSVRPLLRSGLAGIGR